MRLWLCRHAQVLLDPGICYGVSDVQADAAGTKLAAQQLAQVLPSGCPIWASPLGRTRQLADALCGLRPDLGSVVWDRRLREMDFGKWELQAWDTIGQPAVDEWVSNFARHAVGGAESTQDVVNRVDEALQQAMPQLMRDDSGTPVAQHMVWVTHAGVIRAVQFLRNQTQKGEVTLADWPKQAPKPGGYCWVDIEFGVN
jgi:alpha-ribazole phosphatase